MDTKKLMFEIAGGKYEPDGEVNYKYINSTDSAEEALRAYASVEGYPFNYLRVIISDEGARSDITLLGDKTDAEYANMRVRMGISLLWMKATGASFSDLATDPEEQLEALRAYMERK